MEIYFNPQKAVFEVYEGSHEDGEPEYEDQDFMRAVTFLMVQKGAVNG